MPIEKASKELLESLTYLNEEDRAEIEVALELAVRAHEKQKRADGSPYILHPIATAQILSEWKADRESIIAGLLHDVPEDTPVELSEIENRFGKKVSSLVEGITSFTHADFVGQASMDRKVETLRKLFEVMRSDIRVVIIKLADRLHNLRTIEGLPKERRMNFAKETIDVYYKLAAHLGMNDVRRELSETCMPHVCPEEVKEFTKLRKEGMKKGESIFDKLKKQISDNDQTNALIRMSLHPRSFYRMHQEYLEPHAIIDPFCIMVIAKDLDDCYELLKLFHTLYRPISRKFRDYIAAPSESGYQAIRTAVIGPDGVVVPLRIRTEEMEEVERFGVLLKAFGEERSTIPGFSWLERSESIDTSTKESSDSFWAGLESDILQGTINVNVDGDEVSVPSGATVLDAAYAALGEKANNISEITLNGSHTSYGSPLQEEDAVSVSLDEGYVHVSHDWLQFISTHYARVIIVNSLKERDQDEKLSVGERLLQKEFDHFHIGLVREISKKHQEQLIEHFDRDSFEDVVAMVGEGVISPQDVVIAITEPVAPNLIKKERKYPFCVSIRGQKDRKKSLMSQTTAMAHANEIDINNTQIHDEKKRNFFYIKIKGSAPDRSRYADFVESLERQQDITTVRTLLPSNIRSQLLGVMILAFLIILLDIILLPVFFHEIEHVPFLPYSFYLVVPILPIIIANHLLLRSLQKHVVFLRTDRWFIGMGMFMNVVGIFLLLTQHSTFHYRFTGVGLLPILAVFIISTLYIGYSFFRSESLYSRPQRLKPPSTRKWKEMKRRKLIGYSIRLCAVVVWGTLPLYIKYTPTNDVDPLVRVFLFSMGAIGMTILFLIIKKILAPRKKEQLRLPKNIHLLNMIVGDAGWMYFTAAGLLYTTSTNMLLLQNFAPVLTLLIAAILWRHTIPYLKDSKHMVWIFLVFLLGSTGSSLIIFNSIQSPGVASVRGDILSIIMMMFDTLLIIGQIRFIKLVSNASGPAINLHIFTPIALVMLPILSVLFAMQATMMTSLTWVPVLFAVGAGAILGLGQLFNYAAFKLIDGFIAFLMFNISILITFLCEVFFLHKFSPTWILLLGGFIIISSTVIAEMINSRCEKKGY